MKFLKILKVLTLLMAVVYFSSCSKDDEVTIGCTYSQDPECFCQENPNNPLCNIVCTFEANPECSV